MIDYRPVIVQYIKDKAGISSVLDGTLTFRQPTTDYATYYILKEDEHSYVNNTGQIPNPEAPTVLQEVYTPLTIVDIQIDVRGVNSFINSRNLHKSFGTINNKKTLSDQGVFFMGVSGITPLPQLKNTRQEEGYIFDLTISFDNSFIDTSVIADSISLNPL